MKCRDGLSLLAAAAIPASAAPQSDEALPPEFRGEITYSGTYSGELETKRERMQSPGISGAIRSLISSRTLPMEGDYTITIRFEGNAVSGSAQPRSKAGPDGAVLEPDNFTGTRAGAECLLQWSEGPQVPASCGRDAFSYSLDGFQNRREDTITVVVVAARTQLVDYWQRGLERVAQRVIEIAAFADRVEAVRASYSGAQVMPSLACYRRRQEIGLYDKQLIELQWLAGDFAGIGADVHSSGNPEAVAALQSLSNIEELARATRDDRAAAEADYNTACP